MKKGNKKLNKRNYSNCTCYNYNWNGILTQAQRAKTETENAANNEAAILEEYNKYLNNAVGGTSTKPEDTVNAKDVLIPDENGATEEEKSPYVLYNNLLCRAFYNDDTHGLQIITNDSIETFDIYSLAEDLEIIILQSGLISTWFERVYISDSIPLFAIASEKITTLQCDKLISLLI